MSRRLIAKVVFMSSFTVATFGCGLVYSSLRILLCLSNDVLSSPAGIAGISSLFVTGPFFGCELETTAVGSALGVRGFFTRRRSLKRFFRPTIIAPYTRQKNYIKKVTNNILLLTDGFPVGDRMKGYFPTMALATLM